MFLYAYPVLLRLLEISIKEQFLDFVPLRLLWISIKERVPLRLYLMFLYAYLVPLCLYQKNKHKRTRSFMLIFTLQVNHTRILRKLCVCVCVR